MLPDIIQEFGASTWPEQRKVLGLVVSEASTIHGKEAASRRLPLLQLHAKLQAVHDYQRSYWTLTGRLPFPPVPV